METPPGCSSSIRDGFPPSLPLKVCLLNLMLCLRVQSHWLCWIFQLDEELLDFCGEGDGSGSFILKGNINLGNGSSEKTKTAKYSISLQYLFLEGITEDCEM